MKLTYLIHELQKELDLRDKHTDVFLESIGSDPKRFKYLREQVLPVVDKDIEYQNDVVTKELERLLKGKDEKCKQTSQLS